MNSNSCIKNDILLRRMIYLLRKHDIISVPSYAAGIYHPPQVDIIIRYSNQCFAVQSSFFSSLFTLIFSLETTILEKREERIDKSEENKRNDNLLSKIVVSFWWSRGESNPCPKTDSRCFLRAQPIFGIPHLTRRQAGALSR